MAESKASQYGQIEFTMSKYSNQFKVQHNSITKIIVEITEGEDSRT